MKRIIIISALLIASLSFEASARGGPKYDYVDSHLDDEISHIYEDMAQDLYNTGRITSGTISNLTVTTLAYTTLVPAISITNWTSYTPTITGCGTVGSATFYWKQVGDTIFVQGQFQAGTPAASSVSFSLPNSTSVRNSKINSSVANPLLGTALRVQTAATASIVIGDIGQIFSSGTDRTVVFVGNQTGSLNIQKTNGNVLYVANDAISVNFSYPI